MWLVQYLMAALKKKQFPDALQNERSEQYPTMYVVDVQLTSVTT